MSLYSNVLNSIVMFIFLLCTQKASFWASFGPRKNKITFIRWHLGPRLIEYVKFEGDVEFFAEHRKYCFIDKLGTKFVPNLWKVYESPLCERLSFIHLEIRVCGIWWWSSFFCFVLDLEYHFLKNCGQFFQFVYFVKFLFKFANLIIFSVCLKKLLEFF